MFGFPQHKGSEFTCGVKYVCLLEVSLWCSVYGSNQFLYIIKQTQIFHSICSCQRWGKNVKSNWILKYELLLNSNNYFLKMNP